MSENMNETFINEATAQHLNRPENKDKALAKSVLQQSVKSPYIAEYLDREGNVVDKNASAIHSIRFTQDLSAGRDDAIGETIVEFRYNPDNDYQGFIGSLISFDYNITAIENGKLVQEKASYTASNDLYTYQRAGDVRSAYSPSNSALNKVENISGLSSEEYAAREQEKLRSVMSPSAYQRALPSLQTFEQINPEISAMQTVQYIIRQQNMTDNQAKHLDGNSAGNPTTEESNTQTYFNFHLNQKAN